MYLGISRQAPEGSGVYLGSLDDPPGARRADRLLATGFGPASPNVDQDIWMFDVARTAMTRVTFQPVLEASPVWSADGKRVVFTTEAASARSWNSQSMDLWARGLC